MEVTEIDGFIEGIVASTTMTEYWLRNVMQWKAVKKEKPETELCRHR